MNTDQIFSPPLTSSGVIDLIEKSHMIDQFFRSCASNDIDGVKKYIESGGDINVCDIRGRTGLMIACSKSRTDSNIDLVLLLLSQKNCDLNQEDSSKRSALQLATTSQGNFLSIESLIKGNFLIIESLIKDQRLDFSQAVPSGLTQGQFILRELLNIRVREADNLIKFLLTNKRFNVDINGFVKNQELATKGYFNPLSVAVASKSFDLCKFLIENKADLNIQSDFWNEKEITPLILAVGRKSNELIKMFIENENCDLNLQDSSGKTALMHFYFCRDEDGINESFELLINNPKCDLNLKDKGNRTALGFLCLRGHRKMARSLLDTGRCVVDKSFDYGQGRDLIENYFAKQRNKIGAMLLLSMDGMRRIKKIKMDKEPQQQNPLSILPKELIHLTLSYAYPLASQTKYCKN